MAHLRLALLALTLTACASSPKPGQPAAPSAAAPAGPTDLALTPADQMRASQTVVVSAAAPEALAGNLDNLATKLQLPMQLGQMALDQLAQGALGVPLTREQLSRLDPGQSVSVVILPAGPCAALTFKDASLAQKTIAELGPETQRADGATARKAGDSEVWTGLSGRTLLASSSRDALKAAGALALEAQQAPRDGLVAVTLYPQHMAQAQGMPLAMLVQAAAMSMTAELQKKAQTAAEAPAKGKGKSKGKAKAAGKPAPEFTPAMANMVVGIFKAMAQPIVESERVQVSLKLNPSDGFLLRTEIVPLPGSPSAGRTKVTPYSVETKLGISDDRSMVMAFGEFGAGAQSVINALTESGPKGKAMGKHFTTWLTQLMAGGSCVVPPGAPLSALCAIQLRPGATPERALDLHASMMKDAQGWYDELMGPKKAKVKVKRSKDLLEMEVQMNNPDPMGRAMQKAMFGGDSQKYSLAIRDGRLLQVQGPKPREVLERWGKTAPAGATPLFSQAAARTKGADVLFYFDPVAFFSSIVKAAEEPQVKQVGAMMGAVPGLAELKAPMVVALWGGKTTALDIQLPFQTLANLMQVVRPFMGMMGAPGGPPPPK